MDDGCNMNFEASFVVENKIEYSIWDIWDIDDVGIKGHWMCAQLELKIVDKCRGVILYGVMTGLEFKKFQGSRITRGILKMNER